MKQFTFNTPIFDINTSPYDIHYTPDLTFIRLITSKYTYTLALSEDGIGYEYELDFYHGKPKIKSIPSIPPTLIKAIHNLSSTRYDKDTNLIIGKRTNHNVK